MTFTFHPAKRENVPLLIGLAGYTGSGKTYSALLLAKGLSQGKPFAVIDTENGRASHYAGEFQFETTDLRAPFSPERYAEAILAADKAGYGVIVVDSMSHEYAGDGGILDAHETELQRMAGDDWKKREAMTFAAWVKPKMAHKRMVSQLLQVRAHLILAFRAEEKIQIVKRDGKTVVEPKRTLAGGGLDGWIPVTEKTLPYEMTASFLLSPSEPGLPRAIKLQEQHRGFFPADRPIGEEAGRGLAEWASGGKPAESAPVPDEDIPTSEIEEEADAVTRLLLSYYQDEKRAGVEAAVAKNRDSHAADLATHVAWLKRQVELAEERAEVPA